MALSPKVKIGFGVVVIFLAGLLCGGLLAGKLIALHIARNLTFDNFTKSAMGALDKKLTLTPGQKSKIETIVGSTEPEFEEAFGEFGNILVRMHNRIHDELTADQQRTHTEMLAKVRKGLKEKMSTTLPDEKQVPTRSK